MRARRTWIASIAAVIALGAVGLLVIAVGTAPAGNRSPNSKLEAKPGPAVVTYAKNVALTASFENAQKSTFVDVRFSFPLPPGVTSVPTDCQQSRIVPGSPSTFVCNWGHQLRAGETATVAFVIPVPGSGPSQLALTGTWSIKEGSQTKGGGPDTFPTDPLTVALVAANDPVKAGAFVSTACSSPSTPTIATNPLLGPGNPLATNVCATNLPTVPIPGIAAGISERDHQMTDKGVSQVSDICLPAPTASCGGLAFHFSTPSTFTFLIDNAALPLSCGSSFSTSSGDQYGGHGCKLRQITKVFHDGALVSSSPTADPRVVSIVFNNQKKTTTVVVKSSENGGWDFG